jgi:hypothetical protein
MPFKGKRLVRRIGNSLKTGSRKGLKSVGAFDREINKWNAAVATQGAVTGHGLYSGFGAYKKKRKRARKSPSSAAVSNSLIAGSDIIIPSFTSEGNETGGITISRKEYLGDVYAPTLVGTEIPSFVNTTYAINPGVERSFPWLSQIAQNFEEYTLHQLIYTYRSTITDVGNSSTGQCGTVVMCTSYNVNNAPFDDKVNMMEYEGAMSSKSTDSMLHGVECDPSKLSGSPGKYVRANGFSNNSDSKDYDHGLFQIAVANAPKEYDSQSMGELWVSYTISLRKPKFFVGKGFGISQDLYLNTPSTGQTLIAKDALLGSATGKQWLVGELNNLRTVIAPVFAVASFGLAADPVMAKIYAINNAFTHGYKITFPSQMSGFFSIELAVRMRTVAGNGTAGGHAWVSSSQYGSGFFWSPDRPLSATDTTPLLVGNITFVKDIYTGGQMGTVGNNSNSAPVSYSATPFAGQGNGNFRCHVQIRPASGKIENAVYISTNPAALLLNDQAGANGGAIMAVELGITEYNAAFSYRFNNVGPEANANQSQDVIYTDNLGQRVVPYGRP